MLDKMAVFKMLGIGERAFLTISTKCLSIKLYCNSLLQQKAIKELSESFEKPRAPAPPFARFYKSLYADYLQQGLKSTEAVREISKKWGRLSEQEKKKFITDFEQEKLEYERRKESYENSLTEEQKALVRILKRKINKSLSQNINPPSKDELIILKKPTRPMTAFCLFIKESFRTGKSSLAAVASKWRTLSESEKEKYKEDFQKKMEKYLIDLKNWEMKMFQEGKTDVLRAKTLKELLRKL